VVAPVRSVLLHDEGRPLPEGSDPFRQSAASVLSLTVWRYPTFSTEPMERKINIVNIPEKRDMKAQVMLILVILIASGCAAPEMGEEAQDTPPLEEETAIAEEDAIGTDTGAAEAPAPADAEENKEEASPQWVYGGPAIEGNYADSDFVDLGDGRYRMYYATEPEVPGNKLEVYSATSADGIRWAPESGVRRTFTVFPDVVQLPDGTWRMYFQNAGVIKSAASSDGLKWTDESGTRIDTKNSVGLTFERVAGPATIRDGDRYIMAYSGAIPGKYKDAPNPDMAVLLWATSSDGLRFEPQGMALDTRNDKFYGFADTPDLVWWDDGAIRMFFWGYFGIYESTFTGEGFTEPVMVYEAKKNSPLARFPPSPPGDPALGKVGDKWFMYYGQHTKGIFYATLEDETVE